MMSELNGGQKHLFLRVAETRPLHAETPQAFASGHGCRNVSPLFHDLDMPRGTSPIPREVGGIQEPWRRAQTSKFVRKFCFFMQPSSDLCWGCTFSRCLACQILPTKILDPHRQLLSFKECIKCKNTAHTGQRVAHSQEHSNFKTRSSVTSWIFPMSIAPCGGRRQKYIDNTLTSIDFWCQTMWKQFLQQISLSKNKCQCCLLGSQPNTEEPNT